MQFLKNLYIRARNFLCKTFAQTFEYFEHKGKEVTFGDKVTAFLNKTLCWVTAAAGFVVIAAITASVAFVVIYVATLLLGSIGAFISQVLCLIAAYMFVSDMGRNARIHVKLARMDRKFESFMGTEFASAMA